MPAVIELPDIPDAERTALVEELVRLIETLAEKTQQQAETIQQLRDEIAVLKGEKGKPRFKPSGMAEKKGTRKRGQIYFSDYLSVRYCLLKIIDVASRTRPVTLVAFVPPLFHPKSGA